MSDLQLDRAGWQPPTHEHLFLPAASVDFEWSEVTDGHEWLLWEGPRSSDRANGGHVSLLPDGEP